MGYAPATLAVIFDFDDTLVPDSTTALLRVHGVDTDAFWNRDVRRLTDEGYDTPLAYLKLLLDLVRPGEALEGLNEQALREFGATLDAHFYVGLPELFDDLRTLVRPLRDIAIEFYIVSGGLESVVKGSAIVDQHIDGVYGCRLAENPETGTVAYVRRCISFTEKTRYLFEINKGIPVAQSDINPLLVNAHLHDSDRRIPFQNMIYVGDGMTDIPCFSLVQQQGGTAFGVFQPGKESSAKRAYTEFLRPKRVIGIHAPKYRPDDELGSLLRAAVSARCTQIAVDRGAA